MNGQVRIRRDEFAQLGCGGTSGGDDGSCVRYAGDETVTIQPIPRN